MKKTYLVYKQVNGIKQLVVASQEEWDAILKENRKVPAEKRRRFIKDCVEAGEDLDCMYIEVPAYGSTKSFLPIFPNCARRIDKAVFETPMYWAISSKRL